jgi:hypothetical protein
MKRLLTISAMMMVLSVMVVFNGCKKEEEPAELVLATLTANDADLNTATAPTGVDLDAVITAVFSTDVDVATAVTANIMLTRDYDDTNVGIAVAVSGTTLTITPSDPLGTGTLYTLTITTGLTSSEGQALAANVTRSFTTEGVFVVPGAVAQFTFEDNANDVVGDYDPGTGAVVDITYADSHNEDAGKAASFNGTSSLIEIPNADEFMAEPDFTLCFWVKADASKNGQFVLGLAAWKGFQFEIAGDWAWVKLACQYDQGDGTTDSEDSWFPGNGQTKDNGGWIGWTYQKDVSGSGGVGETYFKDKWAFVVNTFDGSTKVATMYINGEKVKQHDFNLWPSDAKKKNIVGVAYAGNPDPANRLALGFIQARENRTITDTWADPSNPDNNHFKGLLDDVVIYDKALTEAEILLMYNSGL